MKISVYITSYNQKEYLIEAIESVLAQTFLPCQIIIVDDCSTDGSQAVIDDFAKLYPDLIVPIYHTKNLGVSQTRIDALNAVTGDYVTYVDGDDRFLPMKLEKEAGLLQENPDAQIAFSNNFYMTEDGIHTGIWADDETPPEGDVFRRTFARDFPKRQLFRNELVKYNALKSIDFYDTNLDLYEDWEMRIRLTKHYRAVYYDEPLSEYRIYSTGLSKSKAAQHLAAVEYIYQKNRCLLDDINSADRKEISQNLCTWIARIAWRAAEEAFKDDQNQQTRRARALKYYFKSLKYNPHRFYYKEMLKFILPKRAYGLMRSIYHIF